MVPPIFLYEIFIIINVRINAVKGRSKYFKRSAKIKVPCIFEKVVGASVSLVVFFIALASGINGTVNYFYPRERAYPRNIREMRSEIVREYCPDRDKDCQLPYTDEQIVAMLEEERQVHLANNRADNFNQAVQAWLMAIIASVFMIYFAKQLKK